MLMLVYLHQDVVLWRLEGVHVSTPDFCIQCNLTNTLPSGFKFSQLEMSESSDITFTVLHRANQNSLQRSCSPYY